MKNYVISIPYVYPACPLSIDHARLFIIADIIARYKRSESRKVIFPVATHYSGIAAHNLTRAFINMFKKNYENYSESEKSLYNLYTVFYKTSEHILKRFNKPEDLLNYFSQEILWELKSLSISCDYENYYTTNIENYSLFVNQIFIQYCKLKVLIENSKGELALDYNNAKWKLKTIAQINKTAFLQPFHKNNIIAAINNIRNDWGLLRNEGMGVKYQEKLIIDPMFDSELFMLFDLFMYYLHNNQFNKPRKEKIFRELLTSLSLKKMPKDLFVKKILLDLPCDIFIGEEHLKNWIVKKYYAETLLLQSKYRTKKYFIVGMGSLDGKRMSASKGHAILTKDLIDQYNGNIARLAILLCGGHPSKGYNYDKSNPILARKIIDDFTGYYKHVLACGNNNQNKYFDKKLLETLSNKIARNIEDGYLRQATIDLLITMPKEYRHPTCNQVVVLKKIMLKYLQILLPGLANVFI